MGLKFGIFARSVNPVGTRFNAVRISGDGPEVPLDPRTNGVAHAAVFHWAIVRPKLKPDKLNLGLPALITISGIIELRSFDYRLPAFLGARWVIIGNGPKTRHR
jgi:hypothetical protein